MATRIRVGQINGAGAASVLVRDSATAGDVSGKGFSKEGQLLIGNGTGFTVAEFSNDFDLKGIHAITIGGGGGSGYGANNTYNGVAITGGSGSGATANVTISGGSVTAVQVVNPGQYFVASEAITIADASIGGGTGASFTVASTKAARVTASGSPPVHSLEVTIAENAVETIMIANSTSATDGVTLDKIQQISGQRSIGRFTGPEYGLRIKSGAKADYNAKSIQIIIGDGTDKTYIFTTSTTTGEETGTVDGSSRIRVNISGAGNAQDIAAELVVAIQGSTGHGSTLLLSQATGADVLLEDMSVFSSDGSVVYSAGNGTQFGPSGGGAGNAPSGAGAFSNKKVDASESVIQTSFDGTKRELVRADALKAYIDSANQGVYWKEPVRAASVSSFTTAAAGSSSTIVIANNEGPNADNKYLDGSGGGAASFKLDGVSLAAGDRVLIKDGIGAGGAAVSQNFNGIYTVGALGGGSLTLTRSLDLDQAVEFPGAAAFVRQGPTNEDAAFVCTNDSSPTLGSTAIEFVQFTGAGQMDPGDGIAKSANEISIDMKKEYFVMGASPSSIISLSNSIPSSATDSESRDRFAQVFLNGIVQEIGGLEALLGFTGANGNAYIPSGPGTGSKIRIILRDGTTKTYAFENSGTTGALRGGSGADASDVIVKVDGKNIDETAAEFVTAVLSANGHGTVKLGASSQGHDVRMFDLTTGSTAQALIYTNAGTLFDDGAGGADPTGFTPFGDYNIGAADKVMLNELPEADDVICVQYFV